MRTLATIFATGATCLGACSPNPVRTLAPVPGDPLALECVRQALDAAGYDARLLPGQAQRLVAERREGAYSTEVRREMIIVTYAAAAAPPQLQASAQAIALHPGFAATRPNEQLPQQGVASPPQERTVADAAAALKQCGRP
jgi:hypothetical protein